MFAQLKGLFSPQAVALALKGLPKIKTTIMDSVFPGRDQSPFALVGISDILDIVGTVPVIRRGGMSVPVGSGSVKVDMIEPLPVKPSKDITGADLNNLRMIMGNKVSLNAWRASVIQYLRDTCRFTTEGIASTALTGTISWPVKLDSGDWDTYEITFGAPLRIIPSKPLDDAGAKVVDVYDILSDMETEIQDAGYGGEIEFFAGKKSYRTIYGLVENYKSTAKLRVSIEDGVIDVGGYKVRKMAEKYRDPKTRVMVPKIPEDEIVGYAKDAPSKVIYCALDDIDANLQPYPFFPKPTRLVEGNGYRIIGQSKPLPARNPKTVCWAKVLFDSEA